MPNKKALIVAIDDYGNPQNNLNSCLNDAAALENLLHTHYGFTEIKKLLNGEATVSNVDNGLADLLSNVTPEDRRVFFYSGHGYQVQKGADRDEVLVLHDGFYEDNRLSGRTQQLHPGTLSVILDSCFSGGLDKVIPGPSSVEVVATKVWKPTDERSSEKMSRATCEVSFKPFGRPWLGNALPSKAADQPDDEVAERSINALLITACLENETASAKSSVTDGLSAFTFGLREALRAGGFEQSPSEFLPKIAAKLRECGFVQTPTLFGPNGSDLTARAFITFAESPSAVAVVPLQTPSTQPAPSVDPNILVQLFARISQAMQQQTVVSTGPAPAVAADPKFWGALVGGFASAVLPGLVSTVTTQKVPEPMHIQPVMTQEQQEKFLPVLLGAAAAFLLNKSTL